MAEQLYSADEAAKILGLQVRTVRNYLREGRLPGVRIGKQYRIARADLEAFTAGLGGSETRTGGSGPENAATDPARFSALAEVSSVVQLDGIGASAADRLERTLIAATLAGSDESAPALRVEPIYDEARLRLRFILVGSPGEVAELLRVVDAFTREPGSPGAWRGS
jgi:excisionase family DNA binding protein